ncbi:MAG: hypothetical protein AAGG46_05670, partial [Planctomycetota bacterium]
MDYGATAVEDTATTPPPAVDEAPLFDSSTPAPIAEATLVTSAPNSTDKKYPPASGPLEDDPSVRRKNLPSVEPSRPLSARSQDPPSAVVSESSLAGPDMSSAEGSGGRPLPPELQDDPLATGLWPGFAGPPSADDQGATAEVKLAQQPSPAFEPDTEPKFDKPVSHKLEHADDDATTSQ